LILFLGKCWFLGSGKILNKSDIKSRLSKDFKVLGVAEELLGYLKGIDVSRSV
jgi:hypothetical protein